MHSEIPKNQMLANEVFRIHNEKEFDRIALEVFKFQFDHNPVYREYCIAIRRDPLLVKNRRDIPFLPISFFKTHRVATTEFEEEVLFKSSGTTGQTTSRHFVKDVQLYKQSFANCFEQFFGKPQQYCILGLLPSYLEQGNSSLVYMVNELIQESGHPLSGFYLHNREALAKTLESTENAKQPTILFGVTYALLDFAEALPMQLNHTIIIETGGMKGRRKEMIREEVHEELKKAFGLPHIHSEYGMTELLSQAYGKDGIYQLPNWMKISLREETDPLSNSDALKTGAINIIDLANIYSCSFIATDDAGRLSDTNTIEILGRLDHSDIRGCSQLAL